MPNKSSAKKRMRQDPNRRLRNNAYKTRAKGGRRKVHAALGSGQVDAAAAALPAAAGALDRAAQKHVIHRNKANRLKSRLQKRINAAQS